MDLDDPRFRSRNVVGNWLEDIAHVRDQERMRKKLERKRRKKLGIKREPMKAVGNFFKKLFRVAIVLVIGYVVFVYVLPMI